MLVQGKYTGLEMVLFIESTTDEQLNAIKKKN